MIPTRLTLVFLLFSSIPASGQVQFTKQEEHLDITIDGKPFATYVWEDERTSRPYFKQVMASGGEVQITRSHPPKEGDLDDHETYHPGVWWGFGDVGGNDYWRMKAKVVGGDFVATPKGGDDRGSFAVKNKMLANGSDEVFCEQLCRFTILKREQGILMICESTFIRKEGDFWLGDQEEMGLGIRVATSIATKSGKGGEIRDSEGRTLHKEIRTNQSDWCDYSGPVAGKHGGILLMNDPSNFRKPWWHAVDTGLLIANPLGESELSGRGKKRENVLVKKGEPFRLRYGALIHLDAKKEDFDSKKAYADFLSVLAEAEAEKSAAIPRSWLPEVPEGFEISVFAQEPLVYKPTSVCFDAKGRLMVGQGPQYPKNYEDSATDSVVLVLDSNEDGVADETKVFATGFNSIQGLAWKGDDLYVANAPELTVVRDLDGDDEADEYIMVYTDLGNREHALHGLNFAPDGKLYMSKGNSKGHNQPDKYGYVAPKPFRELWDVVHPPGAPDAYPPKTFTKDTYRKTYHHWDDDWGREGGVLRCDPLGANLEIVSRGMRNPWDICMDGGFNFLGTDNDQDQGDRIIMPFFGAHFGWGHTYSSHWTGANHLPTAPISGPVFHGSGAGIIFYAHEHLPAEYRNTFIINDWNRGTFLYRPDWEGSLMQPKNGRWETFATKGEGKMLYRPTDLEFGPDGAIYICGWGGGYHYDRDADGSWLFRVKYATRPLTARADYLPDKRSKPYSKWTAEELLADLGAETLPVWRVNAHDELVRRGSRANSEIIDALKSRKLSTSQQTWAIWALATPELSFDTHFFLGQVLDPSKRYPLDLRIQAIRMVAHHIRDHAKGASLPNAVVRALSDPEPRIRFEAVQAVWQARQEHLVPELIVRLARESDRLAYYAGWRALQELATTGERKTYLQDRRSGVRLAALLGLLERHELSLDEALRIAETDPDPNMQAYALTWALNPAPPEKMPNTTARVELEDSYRTNDLIERLEKAKTPRMRQAYLNMISSATYRGGEDWNRLAELYQTLDDDDERALVLVPLSRRVESKPLLWSALSGNDRLRRAAVRGLATLARQQGVSPSGIADFLISGLKEKPGINGAIDALEQLGLEEGWTPSGDWDSTLATVLERSTSPTQAKLLSLLRLVDSAALGEAAQIKTALSALAEAKPAAVLYAPLVALTDHLGLQVSIEPPERATVDGVIAKLPNASPERGRELFFSSHSTSNCTGCHRVSGKGNSFAPDLAGIGQRLDAETLIQSIIDPSATITEGYQLQLIETASGDALGVVLQETDSKVTILKPEGFAETIAAASIKSRKKLPQSVMPATYAFLGEDQIADIAVFLKSLGGPIASHSAASK